MANRVTNISLRTLKQSKCKQYLSINLLRQQSYYRQTKTRLLLRTGIYRGPYGENDDEDRPIYLSKKHIDSVSTIIKP